MPVEAFPGNSPLIVSLPYTGSNIPRIIYGRLNETGQSLMDTDSYLDRLVAGVAENSSVLRANLHRYVSDVDYSVPLKPGGPTRGMVGVVPLHNRDGASIWDHPPTVSEAATWRSMFFAPFHAALNAQIARVRAQHGYAVVLTVKTLRGAATDAPTDFRIATFMAQANTMKMVMQASVLLEAQNQFKARLNGSLQAGGVTKTYGRPGKMVHALDLCIKQDDYLSQDPEPGHYDAENAAPLQARLKALTDYLATPIPK